MVEPDAFSIMHVLAPGQQICLNAYLIPEHFHWNIWGVEANQEQEPPESSSASQ